MGCIHTQNRSLNHNIAVQLKLSNGDKIDSGMYRIEVVEGEVSRLPNSVFELKIQSVGGGDMIFNGRKIISTDGDRYPERIKIFKSGKYLDSYSVNQILNSESATIGDDKVYIITLSN